MTIASAARARAVVCALACAMPVAVARALPVPELRAHVNDYAHILAEDRVHGLESRLADYEERTGHQFALLTEPTLAGDSLEDFSIRAAEQWKLGHKGKDDGLIVLIVPNDRKMRIEVGYGLEGEIPDAIASRVIRDVLAPAFRRSDFAGGIDAAFAVLMHEAGGEGEAPSAHRSDRRPHAAWFAPFIMPLLLIVLFSLVFGRRRRGRFGWWMLPPVWSGGWDRGGGGGGFGGFGGGGRGGFGGGGGFSGGGGGFGGGGASGGW